MRQLDFIEGEILYIDKPLGWTSFDAVKRIRGAITRRLKVKKIKVGHAGTLDPLATGVMIVTTGRATKRIEELQAGVKEYIATLEIGATTPSFDLESTVDAVYPTEHITADSVAAVLETFKGRIEQVPPAFSAIKIDGKRAYNMARKGQTPELKPKILVIDEIELLEYDPLPEGRKKAVIRVVCSKGTYIRALARDIGLALNSGAHLTALQRTRVGDTTLAECMSVKEVADMIARAPVVMPEKDESDAS
ncbi:MAG: tRNA pseudouridine(55) synthase TruB [Muribaculaceae bacterium]|nr:tRNA pseudouridine(55) synthase TruB [Muribaculaceae bacterium]